MKKYISIVLCFALVAGVFCSCNSTSESTVTESSEITTSDTTSATTSDTSETTETTAAPKKESHYEFKPYICSTTMAEIFGEDMCNAYKNYVDAVMAGETSFECKDQFTYDWMMGQFAYRLLPIAEQYTKMPDKKSFADGRGYIEYTIPYEEFQVKLAEFEDIVTGILNEVLDDDYSDFEKALALYNYFSTHYTYDYDALDKMNDYKFLSGYRLLVEKKGICQEVSTAYSYLLLQAGVEATVMMGIRESDGLNHQWSYVKIGDNYYHVDPTYAMGYEQPLCFFMMTDEKRYIEDGYDTKNFVMTSSYCQSYDHPEYPATDTFFDPLWFLTITEWDTESNTVTGTNFQGEDEVFFYENY